MSETDYAYLKTEAHALLSDMSLSTTLQEELMQELCVGRGGEETHFFGTIFGLLLYCILCLHIRISAS